jgi:gliding motility-associated-like protein
MKTLYITPTFLTKNILKALCLTSLLFVNLFAFAEGTAELTPTSASDNQGVLQIWDNNDVNRNSSTFGCPSTKRLYFHVCPPDAISGLLEQVYLGTSYDPADLTGGATLWYRIISPSNTVVFPTSGTGWQQVTNAGAGSIASWNEAKAGPSNIVGGTGGYTPVTFTPMEDGDFYIEFYRKSNAGMPTAANTPITGITAAQIALQQRTKTRLRYFDLTIASGVNGTRKPGRLFSQTWDINVNAANNPFICKMYVYSTDGIVTGLDFNGIRPFGFTIACNPTGVANSGNTAVDRRSIAANSTYADYKIFLNDPDQCQYTTGIFGDVLNKNAITVTGCDVNNRCINVIVDKAGGTELLLNFNGVAGYQFGTSDVLIKQTLVVGANCIPWNSRDGLGNLITPGTNLDMRLDYFNGITHLPLFDVENHPYGFKVSLVRPAGPNPLLFWDDTGIAGGGSNLAGCATTATTGCHGFGAIVSGQPATTVSSPTTTDWGDNKTINTWWYANYINVSATYNVPGSISVDANTGTAGTGSANDINSCTNAGPISLNGAVTGAGGGTWSVKSGITGTFANANAPVTTFTPSTADLSKASIYLYLTSTANGACPAVNDSIKITFIGGPTVTPGPPQSACANNPTLTLAGNYTVATGIIWTGGAGTYVPNNTTKNATYTPTAAEIGTGSVTLTLTTTGASLCPQASGTVTLSYTAAPTVNAGSAATVCVNNPSASLVGTATNQTGVTWSGGTGTFSAPGALSTTYNPSATEKTGNPQTVTLTLTASKAGCNSVTSNVNVTINPSPVVSTGLDRTICKNDSVNLTGSVANATGGIWSGGSGKFTPNATTLTANYKPSAAELAGSSVVLTLTSTGNGTCNPVTGNMTITLNPAPTAVVTAPAAVCDNNPSFTLSSSISGATGQKWIGSGGTFIPNTTASSVTYTPSAAEVGSGFTGIILQTTGGICPPTADTAIVSFNPAPTVDGGLPVSICENNPTGTLTGSVVGISTVTWSSPTGGLFSAPSNPITNYTATATDITNGSVTLTVTANKATCLPVTDQVVVTITPKPTVSAGPARSVCRNNPTATFNGTATGPSGFGVQWTGGDGTFGSATSVNTTYTAGPNDLIAGTVTLTLTTTNNGNCSPVSATTTMTFTPTPVVTPGTYTVCSNNATVSLNGTVTVASGGTWVGGAGSFTPGRNALNPTYTPTAAEITGGTLNLTLQSTGNGNCNTVSGVATITFTAAPTLTPASPVNVCADVPAASVSTTKTLAAGVLWSGGSGTIANPAAPATTYTPTTAEVNTGSVTLTVTTTGNGSCSPVSSTVQIVIAPAPTVNAGSNQVVCGTVATVSNLTGTVTGATGGTWTKVSGTGTFGNANNTSTTYTPSNQDVINGSVTLKLTSTGNGLCQPVSNTMTITYTPVPSINAGPDQIVCSTELPVNLSATGSPAAWAASGGTFGNASSLTTTYTPSAGEIAAGTVTLSVSTLPSGACPVKTSQITITIPAGPIVNPGAANQTMCGSLAAYQLNGTVTNATGGIWTTNGTGSFLPNANTLNATYTPSTTDRTNGSVLLTLTSTGNGFCQQVAKTVTLTITPAIAVSAGPNQTLCADVSGITLNGSVTTATGAIWSVTSGSGSIAAPTSLITTYAPTAADITTGTVSFLLTSTGNGGCPAVTSAVTHTLTPAPTLNQGSNQTVCGDSAYVQLVATFAVATGVKWTSNGTGTFSPNNVTANAKYIPSAADIAAGSITLTAATTGNGTCNPIVKTLTVTITPIVTLSVPSTQTVCENNSTVTLSATTTTAAAVNWTSSGTGTFASQTSPATTYSPSAADISAGIVTLTVKTTGNGTCKAKNAQVQITIVPAPIVDAGLPQTVCSTISAITLNGTVQHAGGGTWTSNGSGSFANANALSTTYAPSQADTTAGAVIFTLTSTGNGTCTPVTKNITVTFKKIAKVNAGPDQTICGDSTYIQLAGSFVNAGGGVWSKSGTGVFFPSTIDMNAVYSPTPADKTSGSVTITLTSTSNGVCPAVSDNLILTITPAPVVTVSSDKTVCANNSLTTLTGTATVSSTIKWTTSGTGTFTPNNTTPTLTYKPSAIDKAAGSVVLAMTTTNNGTCKPAQGFLTLTITPAPKLDAGFDKTICGDSLGVKLDEAALTTATGVQWSTSGSGVFGPNNTTTQPTYFPSATDKTSGKVKLAAITTGNGTCNAVKDTIEITITPVPTVHAGSDISICADTNGVKLAGSSTVAGGVQWTTTGSGIFTPSALVVNANYIPSNADTTAKTVILTLTTTNNGTCKAVHDNLIVAIAPKPIVDAGVDRTVCADVDQLLLGGIVNNASGGLWTTSGSGSFAPSSSTLNPNYSPSASDLTVGTVVLTLASTGNGLCKQVSDNVMLKFSPVATISAGNDLQICNSVTTVNINGSSTNVSSVSWQILSGNGSLSTTSNIATSYNVNPADITAGSVTLKVTGTAFSGCSNVSDVVTITFVAAPPINAGNDKTVCSTDFPITLEGTGSSAQWSGYSGTFSPNDQTLNALYTPGASEVAAHTVTLTLTTTNNGVCTAAVDQVTFAILDGPIVDAGTVSQICANSPSVNLSGTTNGVSSTGVTWSTSGSGAFTNGNTLTPTYTPSSSDKNGGEVVLTISSSGTNAACKVAADTVHLVIAPAPKVTTGVDQIVCGDAATVNISSAFANATGVQWSNVTANGSYGNATSANTTYNVAIPADTSVIGGSITIQVSTTGQLTGCPAATDQMTITFTKKPAVSAGSPITVCTDTTSIPLSGSVTVATGGTWSSPSGGTFTPNANTLNAKYIPSATDKSSGSTLLTLTTTGNGTCNTYTGNVAVTLNPKPTITGSTPQDSICTGNTISATAAVTNTTSMIWQTTGTGTFSTTTGSPTVYTPSIADQLNGGVIIYASTVGSNPCKEIEQYFAITILKSPASLVNAGFDQVACADAGFFPLNGFVGGIAGTGIWTSATGRGDFYPDNTDLNPVFVPAQQDINAGGLTITLTSTNNSICAPSSDDMLLTITPAPAVSAGTAFPPLCADTAYIQLAPTITNALGGEWSTTGTGTFSPSITDLNAVYVPSAADRTGGRIGITLTTTGNGTCNAYSDFLTIRLTPKPTITVGPDKLVCADQFVNLSAGTTVATGVDWSSSGSGIFTAASNTLGTQYILSNADTTNKVFNIFAKTVNQGVCKPVYDTIKITVQPVPVVIASADQAICADANTIQVSSGITNATGVLWTTNGSGSFSPNSSGNPVSYNVSQADAATGTIELYATSANSGICSSKTDTVKVSIAPVPVVSAGAPIICETANGAALNGTVTSALAGSTTWSSAGSGVFAVNNSTLTATYYPTAADIAAGQVTLTLTASNYGTCNAVSNNAILLIQPMPVANAGQDQFSCVGSPVTVSANNTQAGVSYSWTDNTGTVVQPANSRSHTFTVTANAQRILLATDAKGCISRDTVNITTFSLPSFTVTPNPACYSENLLVQSNPAPQPTVPGVYQWFDNGAIMTGQNKDFLIVPDTGTYKIEFSFANCSANGQVKVNPVPTITASSIVACGNGKLAATAVPAAATIHWSLNGAPSGTGNSISITSVPNDTIKYDITVQNPATLCTAVDSVYVIGLPVPQMVSLDSTTCQGLTVRLTARPTNIPDLDQFLQVAFDWRKDGGAIFATDSVITVNALGTYRGAVSIDQCKDTSTNVIAFAAYPTSSLPDQYTYCPDTDHTVSLDPGALASTTYLWNNGAATAINVVAPADDSVYVVTITNQYNCSITDRTTVLSICAPHIDVPTAFTPGLQGGDQFFRGFGRYEENYKIMIFNRWGEVIFMSTDKTVTWDGTYLGEPMPSGTYPWIVTYEGRAQFKGPYKKTGSITIIR